LPARSAELLTKDDATCLRPEEALGYGIIMYQRRIEPFTLDADYYRSRADLCMELAYAVREATPLCARLISLADDYKARAAVAESNLPPQAGPARRLSYPG